MRIGMQRVGTRLTIEIPESVAKLAHLTENSLVEMEVKQGSVVLRPVSSLATLEELLAPVTDDNLHGEVDLGPPVGSEVL